MDDQSPHSFPPPAYPPQMNEAERLNRLRTVTHVLYGLYALFFITGGLTVLVAIIVNYVKRADVVGTPYEAHFEWQIRTFWRCLIGGLIGGVLVIVGVGLLIWGVVGVWMLYRVIKGWLYLFDNKPILAPRAWF
ncbi:hypothetical protein QS306_02805 [Paraburkholderia bonniea]|uniref:DUF4870 family protein n=1 Tax=Paraburkholderia bonniea TaxID=2152891 RepID=UPI0012916752|nr:hypothetical protein [Paraburkholderia bonniea]WJF90617.1 hypothetical protein QS306_02805 [Paraburkholderia bonniea]WJF93932.1 hypothetical protein QS308_02805 [Paraburkholderia bonniea]